jgi:RNA polymerase sigma-70 factor (ECF subfamily)
VPVGLERVHEHEHEHEHGHEHGRLEDRADEISVRQEIAGEGGSIRARRAISSANMSTATMPLAWPAPSVTAAGRLRAFVDEHYGRLWRVLRRLGVPPAQVEDAAQEVLLVLARRLGDVAPPAEWAFAYGTARRVARDARRKAASRPEDADERAVADASIAGHAGASDDRRLLDALLDTLSDEHREVIVLVELEGMTLAETAALLEVPQGTVASRVRRARAALELAAKDLAD